MNIEIAKMIQLEEHRKQYPKMEQTGNGTFIVTQNGTPEHLLKGNTTL